jgi:hypothetical protein
VFGSPETGSPEIVHGDSGGRHWQHASRIKERRPENLAAHEGRKPHWPAIAVPLSRDDDAPEAASFYRRISVSRFHE